MKGAEGLGSKADHVASAERQLGRKIRVVGRETDAEPVVQEAPEFPEPVGYVWDWFQELAGRRTGGGVGPNPLTHQEIEAWSRLTGVTLELRELRLLLRLDDCMMTHFRGGEAE